MSDYNPFKMWGSWVGAILSFFLTLPYKTSIVWWLLDCGILTFGPTNACRDGKFVLAVILPIVIGFLIGWGIHSLCRKLSS